MISGVSGKIPATRLSGFFLILVAVSFLALSAVAYAEEITYTGDKNKLQDIPSWLSDESSPGLFPGTTEVPLSSGNKVIINYDPADEGVTNLEAALGGLSESENAADNGFVLLSGQVYYGIVGGYSYHGSAVGNEVFISGGSVGVNVYGGGSENGDATDNRVTISGGFVGVHAIGGMSRHGDIVNNTVTICGGIVNLGVFGAFGGSGNAIGNSVNISGGTVNGDVYGGWSNHGNATGNIVTISGNPVLAKAYIYGGSSSDLGVTFTGNTLNLESSGISAQGVSDFEYYNFHLPEDVAADEIMLSVAEQVDFKGTTVKVSMQGNTELRKGDKIIFIRSPKGIENAPKNKNCQAKSGSASYEFSIYTDSNNLWAEVTKVSNAAK